MISTRTIKAALVTLLKTAHTEAKVHFDNVEKAKTPYFYVDMSENTRQLGRPYFDRSLSLDICYIAAEDEAGRVDRNELLDMANRMAVVFSRPFKVEDRFITILDADITFFDEVLHYRFKLSFTDYLSDEELGITPAELMQTLELNINKEE